MDVHITQEQQLMCDVHMKKLNKRKGSITVTVLRALLPANRDIQFHEFRYCVVQSVLDFACMDGAKGVIIVKHRAIVNIIPQPGDE
jgi:hypothetical protein